MIKDTPLIYELQQGPLRLGVLPHCGASIAYFTQGNEYQPIFRSLTPHQLSGASKISPTDSACFLLLPWSNRIADGCFEYAGQNYSIARNDPTQKHPIHGHGWQAQWAIQQQSEHHLLLEHTRVADAHSPYHYHAQVCYYLSAQGLSIELRVTNTGAESLPFGLGLHPYFPRTATTQLYAPAHQYWPAADCIPLASRPQPQVCDQMPRGVFDFSQARALPPDTTIDHAYSGWLGEALIQVAAGRLRIQTDCSHFVLYTPLNELGQPADYFCFEPVDHPINAINLDLAFTDTGLTALASGQTLRRHFDFFLA